MEITSIGVVGSGQMGNGIAQVAACSGFEVTMVDVEQEYIDRGMVSIGDSLGRLVRKGRMTEEESAATTEHPILLRELDTAAADYAVAVAQVPPPPRAS